MPENTKETINPEVQLLATQLVATGTPLDKAEIEDDEAEKIREKVKSYLQSILGEDQAKTSTEPEAEEDQETAPEFNLETFVNREYANALEAVADSGKLYNPKKPRKRDKRPHTQAEAIAELRENLTPEQLEVISRMQKPVLILKPKIRHDRYIANLDNGTKMPGQRKTRLWDTREEKFANDDKKTEAKKYIEKWEVGIGEGVQDLEGKSGYLRELIKEWEGEMAPKGVRVPTNKEIALLAKRGIMDGEPLDVKYWSVTRSEEEDSAISEEDGRVSGARWRSRQVGFNGNNPDVHYNFARFRPVVMV